MDSETEESVTQCNTNIFNKDRDSPPLPCRQRRLSDVTEKVAGVSM